MAWAAVVCVCMYVYVCMYEYVCGHQPPGPGELPQGDMGSQGPTLCWGIAGEPACHEEGRWEGGGDTQQIDTECYTPCNTELNVLRLCYVLVLCVCVGHCVTQCVLRYNTQVERCVTHV